MFIYTTLKMASARKLFMSFCSIIFIVESADDVNRSPANQNNKKIAHVEN